MKEQGACRILLEGGEGEIIEKKSRFAQFNRTGCPSAPVLIHGRIMLSGGVYVLMSKYIGYQVNIACFLI